MFAGNGKHKWDNRKRKGKVRKMKIRKVRMAGALLLLSFILTGCTARELETRSFPLALEIGVSEGQLVWACAWPYGAAGSGEEAGGEDKEEEKWGEENEKEENGEELSREDMGEEKSLVEENPSWERDGAEEDDGKETGDEKLQEEQPKQSEEKSTEKVENDTLESQKINKELQINNREITCVAAPTIEEAVRAVQNFQDRYVDYSQVKAILWDRSLKEDPEMERQVLRWLEENPVFARNILIFDVEKDDLNLEMVQQRSQGQPGSYLENLYKNNDRYREHTRTLEEVLYFTQ